MKKNNINEKPFVKEELKAKFGPISENTKDIKRVRLHQGWWRLNVLNKIAGEHPIRNNVTVCNTMHNGEVTGANFLSTNTFKIVQQTLAERTEKDGGKIEETRLFNNLLSSQPLCFNFFAELEYNKQLGLQILQSWWPDITKLNKVLFEYSPKNNYTKDGSAFDIAFDVQFGDKKGFIGLECKYTDTFSYKPQQKGAVFYGDIGNKNFETFTEVFNLNKKAFKSDYFDFVRSKKYNQLFRNQLMAEAMLNNKDFEIIKTGLFCFERDNDAISSGKEFQSMLTLKNEIFTVITYADFITKTQQLQLSWEQREWTMLLWARYCGLQLSEEINRQIN
ncbi:hypothetical protein [Lutibacter sp.]|uniref:PGN_0703 family putative restriction endonuclease n=1 Tax=Lutibacter sp. TaxID=1925666 RepID=UPI00356B5260